MYQDVGAFSSAPTKPRLPIRRKLSDFPPMVPGSAFLGERSIDDANKWATSSNPSPAVSSGSAAQKTEKTRFGAFSAPGTKVDAVLGHMLPVEKTVQSNPAPEAESIAIQYLPQKDSEGPAEPAWSSLLPPVDAEQRSMLSLVLIDVAFITSQRNGLVALLETLYA